MCRRLRRRPGRRLRSGRAIACPTIDQTVSTDDAATTPRMSRSAARPGRLGRGRLGGQLADLAQQVDELLHVAHEVAAGDLLVLDHLGQLLPRRPGMGQPDETRGRAGW